MVSRVHYSEVRLYSAEDVPLVKSEARLLPYMYY